MTEKSLWDGNFIAFFLLVGVSIGAVINVSDDQMKTEIETLQVLKGVIIIMPWG